MINVENLTDDELRELSIDVKKEMGDRRIGDCALHKYDLWYPHIVYKLMDRWSILKMECSRPTNMLVQAMFTICDLVLGNYSLKPPTTGKSHNEQGLVLWRNTNAIKVDPEEYKKLYYSLSDFLEQHLSKEVEK